mmetsp:Transcript_56139/g.180166  ORF Transcript_56139/g.180166 Transcript_56139/m.180166 type:complete len:402 (-) Transcript_56139:29-1234(-)
MTSIRFSLRHDDEHACTHDRLAGQRILRGSGINEGGVKNEIRVRICRGSRPVLTVNRSWLHDVRTLLENEDLTLRHVREVDQSVALLELAQVVLLLPPDGVVLELGRVQLLLGDALRVQDGEVVALDDGVRPLVAPHVDRRHAPLPLGAAQELAREPQLLGPGPVLRPAPRLAGPQEPLKPTGELLRGGVHVQPFRGAEGGHLLARIGFGRLQRRTAREQLEEQAAERCLGHAAQEDTDLLQRRDLRGEGDVAVDHHVLGLRECHLRGLGHVLVVRQEGRRRDARRRRVRRHVLCLRPACETEEAGADELAGRLVEVRLRQRQALVREQAEAVAHQAPARQQFPLFARLGHLRRRQPPVADEDLLPAHGGLDSWSSRGHPWLYTSRPGRLENVARRLLAAS